MTRILATAATVVACSALAVTLTRSAPSAGVTSCAQIAHDYVAQVAEANSLRIDSYRLLACHQTDANHTVARVHVVVDQFGLQQDVILVYHLTRSAWQISDVHPVG